MPYSEIYGIEKKSRSRKSKDVELPLLENVRKFPTAGESDRGISEKKKSGIIQCIKGVPRSKLFFWNSIVYFLIYSYNFQFIYTWSNYIKIASES